MLSLRECGIPDFLTTVICNPKFPQHQEAIDGLMPEGQLGIVEHVSLSPEAGGFVAHAGEQTIWTKGRCIDFSKILLVTVNCGNNRVTIFVEKFQIPSADNKYVRSEIAA